MKINSENTFDLTSPKSGNTTLIKTPLTLLNELSRIGQTVLNEEQSPFSKWDISCKMREEQQTKFIYSFRNSESKEIDLQLTIYIDASGDSFIEAGIENEMCTNPELAKLIHEFVDEPQIKKYFKISDRRLSMIKSIIPNREIISQQFEDYVSHLINLIAPFLIMLDEYGNQRGSII